MHVTEAEPMDFIGWLKALYEAPGTCPPVPADVSLQNVEENGWVERDGEGWRITDSARVVLDLPKRK